MGRRVAVVGAGPSGFYVAGQLLKDGASVDVLERLPTPFGLVRTGVAPDHAKVKVVERAFAAIARNPRFRFFGGVEVGSAVRVDELLQAYDQVVLAVGAPQSRFLDLPGADLPGVHAASELIGWYNGAPGFADRSFPLAGPDLAVVGIGNVALDLARILASPPERLAFTDIADPALAALRSGDRKRVHVLARRGPLQAACMPKELAEIAGIDGVDLRVRRDEVRLDALSAGRLEAASRAQKSNVDFLGSRSGLRWRRKPHEVWLRFLVSPVAFLGTERVEAVRVARTKLVEREDGRLCAHATPTTEDIPASAVFLALGYRTPRLPGVPWDEADGRIPVEEGRVVGPEGPITDLYAVGWAANGAQGLIGQNRVGSVAVARRMASDPVAVPAGDDPAPWLRERVPDLFTWSDWERLDAHEKALGGAQGRPRVKLTSLEAMRAVRCGS